MTNRLGILASPLIQYQDPFFSALQVRLAEFVNQAQLPIDYALAGAPRGVVLNGPALLAAHGAVLCQPGVWAVAGQVLRPGEEPRRLADENFIALPYRFETDFARRLRRGRKHSIRAVRVAAGAECGDPPSQASLDDPKEPDRGTGWALAGRKLVTNGRRLRGKFATVL